MLHQSHHWYVNLIKMFNHGDLVNIDVIPLDLKEWWHPNS